MKFKSILKRIGEVFNDTWYILSPFLFFKLFQMILIIGEFKGVIWVIVYVSTLIICYGTMFYRISEEIINKEDKKKKEVKK